MSVLSEEELEDVRDAGEAALHDQGVVLTFTPGSGSAYGQYDGSYAEQPTPVACQLNLATVTETDDWTQIERGAGTLLLAASQEGVLAHKDRVRVTKRLLGDMTRALLVDVVGEPVLGPVFLEANVQIVPGGIGDA